MSVFWCESRCGSAAWFMRAADSAAARRGFRAAHLFGSDFDDDYIAALPITEEFPDGVPGPVSEDDIEAAGGVFLFTLALPQHSWPETCGGSVVLLGDRVFKEGSCWEALFDPGNSGSEKNVEDYVADWLLAAGSLEVRQQVNCATGRADVVTAGYSIEVKRTLTGSSLKRAVGQAVLNGASLDRRPAVAGVLSDQLSVAAIRDALRVVDLLVCPRSCLRYEPGDTRPLLAQLAFPDATHGSVEEFERTFRTRGQITRDCLSGKIKAMRVGSEWRIPLDAYGEGAGRSIRSERVSNRGRPNP